MAHPHVKSRIRSLAKDQSITLTAQQVNTLFAVLRSTKFFLTRYAIMNVSTIAATLETQVAEQQKLLADLQGEAAGQRYTAREPIQMPLDDQGDLDGRN